MVGLGSLFHNDQNLLRPLHDVKEQTGRIQARGIASGHDRRSWTAHLIFFQTRIFGFDELASWRLQQVIDDLPPDDRQQPGGLRIKPPARI